MSNIVKPVSKAWSSIEASHEDNVAYIDMGDGTTKPVQKSVIYDVLPMFKRTQDEGALFDVCYHIAFAEAIDRADSKKLLADLGYGLSKPYDTEVKSIVSACLEMTTDGKVVFNYGKIESSLTPDEIGMMACGEKNIQAFIERKQRMAAKEAEIVRHMKEAGEVVAPKSASSEFNKPPKETASQDLRDLWVENGMDPSRVDDYFEVFLKSIKDGKRAPARFPYATANQPQKP